ncbi:MAG: hypothetical protein LAT82_04975 [Nanoarchaeota archaeon]|nr:hypothetical protein [Nanoarchaeota archaeon]
MNFLKQRTQQFECPSFFRFGVYYGRDERNLDFTGYINNYIHGNNEIFGTSSLQFSTKKFENKDNLGEYLLKLSRLTSSSCVRLSSNSWLGIETILDADRKLSHRRGLISNQDISDFQALGNIVYVSLEDLKREVKRRDELIKWGEEDRTSSDNSLGGFRRVGIGYDRGEL